MTRTTLVGTMFSVLVAATLMGFGCSGDDGGPSPDTSPPATVEDLSVTAVTDSSVTLGWTAPGDDWTSGTASGYDIRCATEVITEQNWGGADSAARVPAPQAAGSQELFTVAALDGDTYYYFVLKAVDEASNWSDLSNVASGTTTEGTQPEDAILVLSSETLDFGSEQTELTFEITNGGEGTLSWTIQDPEESWITGVSPTAGSTTTETDVVTVTVSRAGRAAGAYSGAVTVKPGPGAEQGVVVTMTVSNPQPGEMVLIPAGSFTMGDGVSQCGRDEREVTLTRGFWLGQHEVTNREFMEALEWAQDHGHVMVSPTAVLDNLGSSKLLLNLSSDYCEIQFDLANGFYLREVDQGLAAYQEGYDPTDHPVKEVTWFGAARYCDWLSLQGDLPRAYENRSWYCNGGDPYSAQGYRLPTDAEWEYAAQFDDERDFPWGEESGDCSRANFRDDEFCVGWTSPVGSYPDAPASLCLSDMAGNVCEWCNDWLVCALGTTPAIDPTGTNNPQEFRVSRGRAWNSGPGTSLRCANRSGGSPSASFHYFGFRIAKSLSE